MSRIVIDSEKCILCRKCVRACTFSALVVEDHRIKVTPDCSLCTLCVDSCPTGAISVLMDTEGPSVDDCSGIWVFIQCERSMPVSASLELLGKASELAEKKACELTAILPRDDAAAVRSLISYGADRVLYCGDDSLSEDDPDALAFWLTALIRERKPEAVLFGATVLGREVAPAVAARIGTGLTADCTVLEIDEETGLLRQTRPAFGGNLMASIICPGHRPQMATVRGGVFREPEEHPDRTGTAIRTTFPAGFRKKRTLSEVIKEAAEEYDITAWDKLVVVGRGIGSKKNLPLMRAFADSIGAGLGCSRPLVEAGWCEYPYQVGQTGHSVSPKLLISVGVSGAIQHLAGIAGAETIIAVNNDEKAPIFGAADYAVVGDCISIIKEFMKNKEVQDEKDQ